MTLKLPGKKPFKKFRGMLPSGNLKEERKTLRTEEDKNEERKLKLHITARQKK